MARSFLKNEKLFFCRLGPRPAAGAPGRGLGAGAQQPRARARPVSAEVSRAESET